MSKEDLFKNRAVKDPSIDIPTKGLSRELSSWKSMKRRCHCDRASGFEYYGGRGIVVCDRWFYSFKAFIEDLGLRPEKTSLDRINPNGNYEPGNCRWATNLEQGRNRRSNKNKPTPSIETIEKQKKRYKDFFCLLPYSDRYHWIVNKKTGPKPKESKSETKTRAVLLRLDEAMYNQLKELAAEDHRDLSPFVRLIIQKALKTPKS